MTLEFEKSRSKLGVSEPKEMKKQLYYEFGLAVAVVVALLKCIENVMKVGWGGPTTFWSPFLLATSLLLVWITKNVTD